MRGSPLCIAVFAVTGCVSSALELEVNHLHSQLDQAQDEVARLRGESEQLRLQAEQQKVAAEQQAIADKAACAPVPTPPPAPLKSAVVQGRVRVRGKPTTVEVRVVGNGINESFMTDNQGRIALELPVGTYEAKLVALGSIEQAITFEVAPDGKSTFAATLVRAKN